MALSGEARLAFDRDGFYHPIQVSEAAESELFLASFLDFLDQDERWRRRDRFALHDRHFDQDLVWDLASSPGVLAPVSELIGPDLLLLGSRFVCKFPGEPGQIVPWHQDSRYMDLDPPVQVVVWYAVDGCDTDGGCLLVIPGSHLGGDRPHHPPAGCEDTLLVDQETDLTPLEVSLAESVQLERGEGLVFDSRTLHSSRPNRTDRPRIGLTLRYVPTSVRPATPHQWAAILIQGEDQHGHFDPITRGQGSCFRYQPRIKQPDR